MRGFFGIGIENGKSAVNLGTLWRSAHSLGAAFIFTLGERYKRYQASDTTKAQLHMPMFHWRDCEDMRRSLSEDVSLCGIEMKEGARDLSFYSHPERAIYILGAEDHGLSDDTTSRCKHIVLLPGTLCLNVAVAGSIVMYDRLTKDAISSRRIRQVAALAPKVESSPRSPTPAS